MENKKNIPIDTQTMQEIVIFNNLYIDKTKQIINLFSIGKYFYILRPRRWGKTLTINILKEILLGNKELFKGTYAYDNYKDWDNTYPVILLSCASYVNDYIDNLEGFINDKIEIYVKGQKRELKEYMPNGCKSLGDLVKIIAQKENSLVSILLDEYDTPFTVNFNNEVKFGKIKDFFKDFYAYVKDQKDNIKICFISGLTKIGQTNIFSGLNNLRDLTFMNGYHDLIGYTQKEIKEYFKDFIPEVCKKNNMNEEDFFKELEKYYDGYFYGENDEKLYNPRSINNFFLNKVFRNYWTGTGTPKITDTFLSTITKENYFEALLKVQNGDIILQPEYLTIYNFSDINIYNLLFLSGYFTYDNDFNYKLTIPNKEVLSGLLVNLSELTTGINRGVTTENLNKIKNGIIGRNEKMISDALNNMKNFLHLLPEWVAKNPEGLLKGLLTYFFQDIGIFEIFQETQTDGGKSDIILLYNKEIFIIEAKVDESPTNAINQIEKKYAEAYKNRKGAKIGISWIRGKINDDSGHLEVKIVEL